MPPTEREDSLVDVLLRREARRAAEVCEFPPKYGEYNLSRKGTYQTGDDQC